MAPEGPRLWRQLPSWRTESPLAYNRCAHHNLKALPDLQRLYAGDS
jgi:hypothetical protein